MYDEKGAYSNFSMRHMAFAAGHGTFSLPAGLPGKYFLTANRHPAGRPRRGNVPIPKFYARWMVNYLYGLIKILPTALIILTSLFRSADSLNRDQEKIYPDGAAIFQEIFSSTRTAKSFS
jgi:hypothetical protein